MWAKADAENIKAPVGIFPSQDENLEEVSSLVMLYEGNVRSYLTSVTTFCDTQFNAFNEIASKKPFASKNRYKVYDTYVAPQEVH